MSETFQTRQQVDDSTYLIKTYNVYDFGTGELDTVLQVPPVQTDSLGVIQAIASKQRNEQLAMAAYVRNAMQWRKSLGSYNSADTEISDFSGSETSLAEDNARYWLSRYIGRYRIVTDTSDFFVEIEGLNPNNEAVLRATGTDGEGNFNVRVYSRWSFRIAIDGTSYYMFWTGEDKDRPMFRPVEYILPMSILSDQPDIRIVKLN